VHDEIVVECDESAYHDTSLALGKAMSESGGEFISSVPVKVDVRVSDAWAK
jgi:DNA polymerase I-like protein with 3'-5' exonuclease and polymerase domains